MFRGLTAAVFVTLSLAPSALAGGPSLLVGAAEDGGKSADPGVAKATYDRAQAAGFDTVRLTAMWQKGMTSPPAAELTALQNAVAAAAQAGIRTFVVIHNQNSANTPTTDVDRAQFVQYAQAVVRALPSVTDVVVGNEPNINTYWLPQFNADGSDAAAQAYETLLAQAYDGIKAVRASVRVFGGALSPRGADNPTGTRPTHSPTQFIKDLGTAYRASGRTAPIMTPSTSTSTQTRTTCRRACSIRTRRRSRSPTTESSSRSSDRRSTAPLRQARRCRSSTGSPATRPRSRARKPVRIPAARTSPSPTRRRRLPSGASRSSSRTASPT